MWASSYSDRSIVKDEIDAHATIMMEEALRNRTDASYPIISPWPNSTGKEEYCEKLEQLIGRLRNRGGKTVISRVVSRKAAYSANKWVETAERIFASNPTAFCSLYYTPETGAWICASPEILLDADFKHGNIHTIALAGTRRRSLQNADWSAKDVMEHDVVKRYISERVAMLGAKAIMGETVTCAAGEIEHLRTSFDGKMPEGFRVGDFLDTVSPTPALCGYPKATAKEDIKCFEGHPRYCYGGYVTVESVDRVLAYVNIRCLNFDESTMTLYAGSGIMPDSTAEGEWDETEAKLNAIGSSL